MLNRTLAWMDHIHLPLKVPAKEVTRIHMQRYKPNPTEIRRGWYGPVEDSLKYPRVNPLAPRCGYRNKNALGCMHVAGFLTDHLGIGPCSRHGGNSKKYLIQSVREYVNKRLEQGLYGDPLEIGPDEALLMEVQRTAGHVEWLRQAIVSSGQAKQTQGADPNSALYQWTEGAGVTNSGLVASYKEERIHLVRVSKAAIDAGVAVRRVEIAQAQAQMMAHVMLALISDKELGLDYNQQMDARKLIRKHIEAAPLEATALPETVDLI